MLEVLLQDMKSVEVQTNALTLRRFLPAVPLDQEEASRFWQEQAKLDKDVMSGTADIVCFAIPVLNEAATLPTLLESIKNQVDPQTAMYVVVIDNGSTDQTSSIAESLGCNVTRCETPGISPARRHGLESITQQFFHYDPNKVIVVQTDADCKLNPGFVRGVVEIYRENPHVMASVGPTQYILEDSDRKIVLNTGRDYVDFFKIRTFAELFQMNDRDLRDYLQTDETGRAYYLPGPNTVMRLAVIDRIGGNPYRDVTDRSSIRLSYRLQRILHKGDEIIYIPQQRIEASTRAISGTNHSNIIDDDKLNEVRTNGTMPIYNKISGILSPFQTLSDCIQETDNEVYNLQPGEEIAAVIEIDQPVHEFEVRQGRVTPSVNTITNQPIHPRREIVIAQSNYEIQIPTVESAKTQDYMRLLSIIARQYRRNALLLLGGGFAVEAISGGIVTREHHDMDIKLVVPVERTEEELKIQLLDALNKNSSFRWKSLDTKNGWIWLQEDQNEDGVLPRRLDVQILRSDKPIAVGQPVIIQTSYGKYTLNYNIGSLIDEKREPHFFWVPDINALIAEKVRLCISYKESGSHHIDDIKRLLSMSGSDRKIILQHLTDFFQKVRKLTIQEAQQKSEQLLIGYLHQQ